MNWCSAFGHKWTKRLNGVWYCRRCKVEWEPWHQ